MFSSFLGSVTTLITWARKQIYESMSQDRLLRTYLHENHVTLDLGYQIIAIQNEHRPTKINVSESDVPILQDLPMSMKMALRFQVYWVNLRWNPFFEVLGKEKSYADCTHDICFSATSSAVVAKGAELFHYRQPAKNMIFVKECDSSWKKGEDPLRYYPARTERPGISPVAFRNDATQCSCGNFFMADAQFCRKCGASRSQATLPGVGIQPGDSICETALWLEWRHCGNLCAQGAAEIVNLDADKFRKTAVRHPRVYLKMRFYALVFFRRLSQEKSVNDMFQPFPRSRTLSKEPQKRLIRTKLRRSGQTVLLIEEELRAVEKEYAVPVESTSSDASPINAGGVDFVGEVCGHNGANNPLSL